MPRRFIFRQVCTFDLPTFLADGEIRAKNHANPQQCHQTSYEQIVARRGAKMMDLPHGGVVNDYVPFYFSPRTKFTYTIHKKNVDLRSPTGELLGKADDSSRMFFVCEPTEFIGTHVQYCFSNLALNTNAPFPLIACDIDELEKHIDWAVFDDQPVCGKISEIGYGGVCPYFLNKEEPLAYQNRSEKRMAEFLVKDAVPLSMVRCIIAKTPAMQQSLQAVMDESDWDIPIYTKPGCYF